MKQVIQNIKDGKIYLEDVPVPQLGSRGALVRTHYSVISIGTERAVTAFASSGLLGKAKERPDLVKQVASKIRSDGILSAYTTAMSRLDSQLPLGYSSAGEIIALGDEAPGFSIGDRVACGGGGYACHAEISYIPRNLMVLIPEGVSYEEAAFTTIGSVALQGIRLAKPELGERIAVIGLGLIGLLTVQIVRANGCRVMAIDISEKRANFAAEIGADFTVIGNPDDVEEKAIAFTGGRGMDAVIIAAATKSSEPIDVAGRISRHKGRVIVIGDVGMDIPRRIYYPKELEIKVSMSYGPGRYDPNYEEKGIDYPYPYVPFTEQRNMETFLGLIKNGKVTPSRFVTHRFPLEEAEKVYASMIKSDQDYLGVTFQYLDKPNTEDARKEIRRRSLATTESTIGVGLIGAGNFAKSIILPNLKKDKDNSLKGVSTRTGASCRFVADRFGFEFCTTDNEDIFNEKEIDSIYIATRHNLHAELTIRSMHAGKHTFVEKPLATTEVDLRHVYGACRESDRVLMVGFNRRFSPLGIEAKRLFSTHTAPLSMIYRINAGSVPKDHWTQDSEEGAGRIVGEVCHFIDFLQFICGAKPVMVYAIGTGTTGSERMEENVIITLRFQDGSIGTINYFSKGNKVIPKEYIEIFGEGKVMVIDDFKKAQYAVGSRIQKIKGKKGKGHEEEFKAFTKAIREGEMPISLDELVATTLTTFRILDSLAQKREVPVEWTQGLD